MNELRLIQAHRPTHSNAHTLKLLHACLNQNSSKLKCHRTHAHPMSIKRSLLYFNKFDDWVETGIHTLSSHLFYAKISFYATPDFLIKDIVLLSHLCILNISKITLLFSWGAPNILIKRTAIQQRFRLIWSRFEFI